MKYVESEIQTAIVDWFKYQHPKIKDLLVHVPNGQNVGSKVGARLNKMGLIKGFPDLALLVVTSKHPAMFLELKSPKGRLAPEQKEVHAQLLAQGYEVKTAYGYMQGIDYIQTYLNSVV